MALILGWSLFRVYKYKQPIQVSNDTVGFESPEKGQKQLAQFIGFNKEQQQKFNLLESSFRQKIEPLQSQMDETQSLIMQELQSANPDTATLNYYADLTGKIQTAIKKQTIDHFMAVKSMCTPQQLKQFTVLFMRMEQRAGMKQSNEGDRPGAGAGPGPGQGSGPGQGPDKGKQFRHGSPSGLTDSIR
jgi:Spy/CpxP family protein refolding chaperone